MVESVSLYPFPAGSVTLRSKSSCPDPETFVRGGPTVITFFSSSLVDEGRKDPNTNISWSSSGGQGNAI